MDNKGICELCGEPMPPGEDMFKFHGYSGPCPKPPLPRAAPAAPDELLAQLAEALDGYSGRYDELALRTLLRKCQKRIAANAALAARCATARADALEEAAAVCDDIDTHESDTRWRALGEYADAIRALASSQTMEHLRRGAPQ